MPKYKTANGMENNMKKFNEILQDTLKEAITIDVDKYKASHSKAPKGSGQWMFGIGDYEKDLDSSNFKSKKLLSVDGTYKSAADHAKKIAKNMGETKVVVLP